MKPGFIIGLAILILASRLQAFTPADFAAAGEPAPPGAQPAGSCRLVGKVLCSEYGTRYKDPLLLVFEGGGRRLDAEISQDDGSFEAVLARGSFYEMRIEFAGKGFPVGRLEVPADAVTDGCMALEIYHPGSMLELVWEARAGNGEGGVDFRLKEAPKTKQD